MSEEKKGAARLDTSSRDAMHWAECLSEAMGESLDPTDTGWLVGWFANYWAAVHDPLQNTIQSQQEEIDRLSGALSAIIDDWEYCKENGISGREQSYAETAAEALSAQTEKEQ